MEYSSSWPESSQINRIKAIQELTQGQVLTDWLEEMICQPEETESRLESFDDVLVQLSGVFGNTVSVLSSSSSKFNNISFNQTRDHTDCPNHWEDDSKLEDFTKNVEAMIQTKVKVRRGCYKRRKNPMIHSAVSFNLVDDGYAWRKYGQKAIINSKHQRQYYRCSHKYEQGCKATKQVQMIGGEPSKYKITYHRHHTCNNLQRPCQNNLDSPNPKDDNSSVLISFETNPRKQVGFSSTMRPRHKPNKGFPSLNIIHDKVSSSDHCTTWDPVTQSFDVPLEHMTSMMMTYGLDDHEDIFYSTCGTSQYEIDDMLNDFGVLFPELCS